MFEIKKLLLIIAGILILAACGTQSPNKTQIQSQAFELEGDAANGAVVANKCKMCHDLTAAASLKMGSPLWNVYGSTAGAVAGYKYSKAMADKGAAGMAWDEENLDGFIENPKGLVPGTKMFFPGIKNAQDRADLIEYLETLK